MDAYLQAMLAELDASTSVPTPPEVEAGYEAGNRGDPCVAPAEYNELQRQQWYNGYNCSFAEE